MGSDKERQIQHFTPESSESEPTQFSAVHLRDLYGDYTLKPGTRIITDIPNDESFDFTLFDDHRRLRDLADRYGLISIGSGAYGGFGTPWQKPFIEISAGMGPPKANWVPHVFERGALLALAHSVSGGRQPLIMDVGCAGGISSKLIGVDREANVVGVDPYQNKHETLGELSENVEFRNTSLFRQIGNFGPNRTSENLARTNGIIKQVYDSFKKNGNFYFWAMQHGMSMEYQDFSKEIRELQKLASKAGKTSPVDIVLCSFMTTGTDLTLAIRDGIRPKAIVYVKPISGLSGVGDFYQGAQKGGADKVTSFNPGRDYRTVARWQTFWSDDWTRWVYEQDDQQYYLGQEPAEVVVQLRKDVKPEKASYIPTVRTYPFDKEIINLIKGTSKRQYAKTDFYRGVMERVSLLKPRPIELPYQRI